MGEMQHYTGAHTVPHDIRLVDAQPGKHLRQELGLRRVRIVGCIILVGKTEPFHVQTDDPVALSGKEGGILAPGKGRASEPVDKHYRGLRRLWILFLEIDADPIDVKKSAVLANKRVWGYFSLILAERYQVGKGANDENKRQYYVTQYP